MGDLVLIGVLVIAYLFVFGSCASTFLSERRRDDDELVRLAATGDAGEEPELLLGLKELPAAMRRRPVRMRRERRQEPALTP